MPKITSLSATRNFDTYKSTWERMNHFFMEYDAVSQSLKNTHFYVDKVKGRKKLMKEILHFKGTISSDFDEVDFVIGTKKNQYHPDLVSYLIRCEKPTRDDTLIQGFRAELYKNSKPFNAWTSFDLKYRGITLLTVEHDLFHKSLLKRSEEESAIDKAVIELHAKRIIKGYDDLVRSGHFHHTNQSGQENQHKLFCSVISEQAKDMLSEHYNDLRFYYEAHIEHSDMFYGHGYLDIVVGKQAENTFSNEPRPSLFFIECKSLLEGKKQITQTVAEMMAVNAVNQMDANKDEFPSCHALLSDGVNCRFLMVHDVTSKSIFIGTTEVIQLGTFVGGKSKQEFLPIYNNVHAVAQIMYVLSHPKLVNPGLLKYMAIQDQVRVFSLQIEKEKARTEAETIRADAEKARADTEKSRADRLQQELDRARQLPRLRVETERRRQTNRQSLFSRALNYVVRKITG
ncbi:hypothetical protein AKO1_000820 [Acrasis kona]|uniref:Uncharacterized protein n=1 Tax=Acrasis kona TaxID=1008807 RepID=A0AAW2ZF42_9EUKA